MSEILFGFNTTQKKSLLNYLHNGTSTFTNIQNVDVVDGSYTITPSGANITVLLNGSDADGYTISFPDRGEDNIGQIVRLASMVTINNLTLTGTTIMNPVDNLLPNDCVGFQKISEDTWIRII